MKNENKLSHVRALVYSTPWAITPEWLETISAIIEAHIAGQSPQAFFPRVKRGRRCPDCKTGVLKAVMMDSMRGPVPSGEYTCPDCGCKCEDDNLPPYEIVNGVAILQLMGPLFTRADWFTRISGATCYDQFGNDFSQAFEDSNVASILIESDSPGGSCLRLSELCSRIHAARELGSKPIFGLVDPMACSAAYAIVSQCDRVYITESGMAGSIGTILKYNNWDRAERNEGNDPVMMTSSDVKAFGQPQSVNQYDSLRETLMAYFDQFKEIVARGRQGIDIEKVSGAKVWIGRDAVKIGIADGISTMEQIISELSVDAVV